MNRTAVRYCRVCSAQTFHARAWWAVLGAPRCQRCRWRWWGYRGKRSFVYFVMGYVLRVRRRERSA